MRTLKRAVVSSLALLMLTTVPGTLFAQRPLCSELPAIERDRARAAGVCRDPAPIIDVPPRPEPETAAPPSLAVPNVVGLSFYDARERLTRFTLNRVYNASAEPGGTVLAQSPTAAATLPAGAPVNLVLSDGSLVRVPRVTSININDARQRLQEVDVKPQPVVVTSDQRLGTVIDQQPAEGAIVKRGSVVRLQVSAGQEGPEQIDVPNVVGVPFDRARSRLARFTIERVDRPRSESNTAPEGQVVEQTPRAATRAAAGSVIVLTVSGAPRAAIEVFEMPNVIGRSFIDASRTLAEFRVARTDSESATPRGQVLAQTPAAGSALRAGDTVTLQVSVGKNATAPVNATATAPDVDAGSWRAVLAIGGGILLGLIAGALLMRQWLLQKRAAAAADQAIAALTPMPLATVDILLDASPPRQPSDEEVQARE
jgi:beta-lactam-binding protein with PASTA domain